MATVGNGRAHRPRQFRPGRHGRSGRLYANVINGVLSNRFFLGVTPMFSSEVTVIDRSRRSEERLPADMRARYGAGGRPERALCRILDVTKRGARLEVYCDLPPATMITLQLPYQGMVRARVVWSKDFEAGCRFQAPLKDSELESIFATGHA